MEKICRKVISQIVFTFIKIFKAIFLMENSFGTCKYEPSCSLYAKEALETNSFYKASIKIIWRILRCNPLSKGGYDPVNK